MNFTRKQPALQIGDRFIALPGSALHGAIDDDQTCMGIGGTTSIGGSFVRLDERHPCGALEFVVIPKRIFVQPTPILPGDPMWMASKPPTISGDACGACGSLTMVRTGTCMTCQSCGTTSGCS